MRAAGVRVYMGVDYFATDKMANDGYAVDAELIEHRRSELSLLLDRIARPGRCGAAMTEQVDTNDAMMGAEYRGKRIPPVKRYPKPLKRRSAQDWAY